MGKPLGKTKTAAVLERDGGLCVRDVCDSKVFARGWCRKHWQEWRDTQAQPCYAAECDAPARSQGLCNKHWQRKYHTGTLRARTRPTVDERFESKIDKSSGCWLWTGALFDTGYGAFNIGSRRGRSVIRSAHRYAYEREHGKQPSEMHIDHLCRVRSCCNPDHLELVTPSENNRRGNSGPKDHCKRGHSMSDAYVRPDTGTRMCRACQKLRRRRSSGSTKKNA